MHNHVCVCGNVQRCPVANLNTRCEITHEERLLFCGACQRVRWLTSFTRIPKIFTIAYQQKWIDAGNCTNCNTILHPHKNKVVACTGCGWFTAELEHHCKGKWCGGTGMVFGRDPKQMCKVCSMTEADRAKRMRKCGCNGCGGALVMLPEKAA